MINIQPFGAYECDGDKLSLLSLNRHLRLEPPTEAYPFPGVIAGAPDLNWPLSQPYPAAKTLRCIPSQGEMAYQDRV